MKKIIILISTALVSAISFAVVAAPMPKNSRSLQNLYQAWNRRGIEANPAQLKQDEHIVYGGQDISRRPTEIVTTFA